MKVRPLTTLYKHLKLTNITASGGWELDGLLKGCTALRHLHLQFIQWLPKWITTVLSSAPAGLTTITIAGPTCLRTDLAAIAAVLCYRHLPNLERVELDIPASSAFPDLRSLFLDLDRRGILKVTRRELV